MYSSEYSIFKNAHTHTHLFANKDKDRIYFQYNTNIYIFQALPEIPLNLRSPIQKMFRAKNENKKKTHIIFLSLYHLICNKIGQKVLIQFENYDTAIFSCCNHKCCMLQIQSCSQNFTYITNYMDYFFRVSSAVMSTFCIYLNRISSSPGMFHMCFSGVLTNCFATVMVRAEFLFRESQRVNLDYCMQHIVSLEH